MHTQALRHLRKADPMLAQLIRDVGPCRLEVEPDRSPFEALIRAVAHQQLTGRVADVILGRFEALFPGNRFPSPARVLAVSTDQLRQVGFSQAKAASIHDIATQTLGGIVPSIRGIQKLSDDEIIQRLTQVRGVGRWTVEMLLMFTLGRPDVLPADDFGVRKGFALAFGLSEFPTSKALRERGEPWKPFRTVASWYLWRAVELHEPRGARVKGK